MIRRLVLGVPVAALLGIAAPGHAIASCVEPPTLQTSLDSAALVFVGTVTYTYEADRVAHVRVESIWRGQQLNGYVDVHGSPVSGQGSYSSVDRRYSAGTRYLFVLYSAKQPLQDNSCSATQPYSAALAAHAPAAAHDPSAPSLGDEFQNFVFMHALPIGAALAAMALVVVAVLVRRRRMQSPRAMR